MFIKKVIKKFPSLLQGLKGEKGFIGDIGVEGIRVMYFKWCRVLFLIHLFFSYLF